MEICSDLFWICVCVWEGVCMFVCALECALLRFHRAALDHHVTMKPWRNPRHVRMSDCMMDDIMLSGDDNMQATMVTASFCSFHFNISETLSETGNIFPLPSGSENVEPLGTVGRNRHLLLVFPSVDTVRIFLLLSNDLLRNIWCCFSVN